MAYIAPEQTKSQYEQNLDYLRGTAPMPTTGGVSSAPSTFTGGAGASLASAAAPFSQDSSTAGAGRVEGDLAGTLSRRTQEAASSLAGASAAFRQEAGTTAGFTPEAGQAAIQGNDMEAARRLLSASYEGPQRLSDESIQPLRRTSQELSAFGRGLGSTSGLTTLVQQSSPQLTPGAAEYEARLLGGDPRFRARSQEARESAQELARQIPAAERSAESLAASRAQEESQAAERARAFFGAEKAGIVSDIDQRLAEEQERQRQTEEAYRLFQETGDISHLEPYIDTGAFDTPTQAKIAEAARRFQEVVGQAGEAEAGLPGAVAGPGSYFSDPSNLPLTLGISSHGREKYRYTPEFKEELKDEGLSKGERRRLKKETLIPIQKELESAGFSPETARVKEQGEFAPYLPLYFAPPLSESVPRNYIQFDPGVSPARENLATDEQRRVFNFISEALDEVGRLEEAGEPFRAASIAADVDRYLSEEESALEEQKDRLTDSSREWKKQVRRARRAYRKSKAGSGWGKALGVLQIAGGAFSFNPYLVSSGTAQVSRS